MTTPCVRGTAQEELQKRLPKDNGTGVGDVEWTVGTVGLVRKWGAHWGGGCAVSDFRPVSGGLRWKAGTLGN